MTIRLICGQALGQWVLPVGYLPADLQRLALQAHPLA